MAILRILYIVFALLSAAATMRGQPLLEQQIRTNLTGLLVGGHPSANKVGSATLSAELAYSAGTLRLAQQGATSGQFLSWNGTAWGPATALTLPSGTTNYTIRYNGSSWVSSGVLQNDGTQVGINAAPLSGIGLYVNGTGRYDGSLLVRGAGSVTGTSASSALKLQNTGGSGDIWFLGSQDAGTFLLTGQSAGDVFSTNGNDLVVSDRLRVTTLGATATTLVGRNASNELASVTIGSGLSLSAGTLSATASGVTQSTTLVNGRVTLSAGSNSVTDDGGFLFNTTSKFLTIGTGTPSAHLNIFPTATSGTIEGVRASASTSGNFISSFLNANNGNSNANSLVQIGTGGASAGDPTIQMTITGGGSVAIGIDNSAANDPFRMTPNSSLPGGTANSGVTITTTGTPNVGINKDAPTHPLDVTGRARANVHIGIADINNANVSFSTGAGSGPTLASVSGTSNGFQITFNTGTAPVANATIVTISFNTTYPTFSYATISSNNSLQAATDINKVRVLSGANSVILVANGTLLASTSYAFNVVVSGY